MKKLALIACIAGCAREDAPAPGAPVEAPVSGGRDYEKLARELYAGEEGYEKRWPVEFHIRIVEGITQDLNRAIADLGGNIGPDLFADEVELGWGEPHDPHDVIAGITSAHWTEEEIAKTNVKDVRKKWLAYLDDWKFVERVLIKVKTNPRIPAPGVFEATGSVEIAGQETSGGWRYDKGKAHFRFERVDRGWRIAKLDFDHMETERRAKKIFDDATARWIAPADERTREKLTRRSASDEIHARLVEGSLPDDVTVQPVAMDAHPGVVVVDVDGDSWDDLFVWDVLGRAMLLRNRQGQGFEEAADRFGLGVSDVSAAAFADLDGDGVLDAVIGRWFGRSEILRGVKDARGVTYVPSSVGREMTLPSEVASLAIADVNRDGRLDVFFGTAAHDYHGEQVKAGRAPSDADAHVGQLGPRDLLLINKGDRWEDGTYAAGLTQERNTLAPAFADWNGDGWVDLFVGNDFARANLYRNDGGRFVDISKESGADRIIYGMGASWGDFDGDGDLDVYASAMQSSAGARIMSDTGNFAGNLDERDRVARKDAARGNTLLRNDGNGKWSDATSEDAYKPARGANWAYGAQLVDVDGDGWLDAFSPNGFFTAPGGSPDGLVRDL